MISFVGKKILGIGQIIKDILSPAVCSSVLTIFLGAYSIVLKPCGMICSDCHSGIVVKLNGVLDYHIGFVSNLQNVFLGIFQRNLVLLCPQLLLNNLQDYVP